MRFEHVLEIHIETNKVDSLLLHWKPHILFMNERKKKRNVRRLFQEKQDEYAGLESEYVMRI